MGKAIYVVIVVIIILILLFVAFNKSLLHVGDITTNRETDKGYLTKDVMSIVGKYFKSPADYANLSKSSKKYNDITGYYHYNPLQDHDYDDLFPNMQTYEIRTEDEIELPEVNYTDEPLSAYEHEPYPQDHDYGDFCDVIEKLVSILEEIAFRLSYNNDTEYIIRYYPRIPFSFRLLKAPNNVIFENVVSVPFGIDLRRFKTKKLGLHKKHLISYFKNVVYTDVREMKIPEGITEIADLYGYNQLTSIQLPSTLTSIHLDDECPELHNLSLPAGMDLDLYDIAKSNINHIDVDVNSRVLTHGYRPDGEKIINITFRNAGQHNEDLTIAIHDNEQIERLIILNGSSIEVIDGEICIDGSPISEL